MSNSIGSSQPVAQPVIQQPQTSAQQPAANQASQAGAPAANAPVVNQPQVNQPSTGQTPAAGQPGQPQVAGQPGQTGAAAPGKTDAQQAADIMAKGLEEGAKEAADNIWTAPSATPIATPSREAEIPIAGNRTDQPEVPTGQKDLPPPGQDPTKAFQPKPTAEQATLNKFTQLTQSLGDPAFRSGKTQSENPLQKASAQLGGANTPHAKEDRPPSGKLDSGLKFGEPLMTPKGPYIPISAQTAEAHTKLAELLNQAAAGNPDSVSEAHQPGKPLPKEAARAQAKGQADAAQTEEVFQDQKFKLAQKEFDTTSRQAAQVLNPGKPDQEVLVRAGPLWSKGNVKIGGEKKDRNNSLEDLQGEQFSQEYGSGQPSAATRLASAGRVYTALEGGAIKFLGRYSVPLGEKKPDQSTFDATENMMQAAKGAAAGDVGGMKGAGIAGFTYDGKYYPKGTPEYDALVQRSPDAAQFASQVSKGVEMRARRFETQAC